MKKDIEELEKKLRKITGEDKLRKGELTVNRSKKPFNATAFKKLAREIKKVLEEDARSSNTAIRY